MAPHACSSIEGRRLARLSAGPLLVALLSACSGPAHREGEKAPPPASGAGVPASAAPGAKPACALEGDWTPCAVEDRLLRAGVVAERQPAPVRHPFFAVEGILYQVGGPDHELQVFLYPSAAARARDTDALDSATVAPRGTRVMWKAPPTLVTSNNLAAVILSLNDRTVERLALALGAGLPQPGQR